MRSLRMITVSLILVFGALSLAHAQTTQNYSSNRSMLGWGLLIGNCQLRVQSFGAGFVFIPVGNSSLQFQSELPDDKHLGQPLKIVQKAVRGDGKVTETLNVFFALKGTQIVPTGYSLTREYTHASTSVEKYIVNCTDLQADAN